MKRVWAVARGAYSDYGVLALAASKEQAEAIVVSLNARPDGPVNWGYDDAFVDAEITLFEDGDDVPTRVTVWSAWASESGYLRTSHDTEPSWVVPETAGWSPHWPHHDGAGAMAHNFPSEEAAVAAVREELARQIPQHAARRAEHERRRQEQQREREQFEARVQEDLILRARMATQGWVLPS